MGRIIAIANQKGGVGKTTTAVNLASILAYSGKRILLIDSDPQGNVATSLGIEKKTLESGVYDLLMQEAAVEKTIMKTRVAGMDFIPATVDLVGAQVELVGEMGREYRLMNGLKPIVDSYDIIFIDCPPELGLLTLNALAAADAVLIPIQCEYLALDGLTQLLETVKLVKKNLNPKLAIEGVLLTMYDVRTNLSNQVVEEVTAYFKEKTYKTIIPRNVRLSEAPSHGKPVIDYDKDSIGAKSYRDLAEEFLRRME
ncbi:MAG: ParA family protein [Spirochaetes bacterium]|nr:ParA family protein [Spirochaetota bacterium]